MAELEQKQTKILQRISKLELLFHLPQPSSSSSSDTESRLSSILKTHGVNDFSFKRVPVDYYDWPLQARRDSLGAASVDHLCKSIVLVCPFSLNRFIVIFSFIKLYFIRDSIKFSSFTAILLL